MTGELFRRRMEVATFGFACLCLLGVYGGLTYLDVMDVDLAAKLARLSERLI